MLHALDQASKAVSGPDTAPWMERRLALAAACPWPSLAWLCPCRRLAQPYSLVCQPRLWLAKPGHPGDPWPVCPAYLPVFPSLLLGPNRLFTSKSIGHLSVSQRQVSTCLSTLLAASTFLQRSLSISLARICPCQPWFLPDTPSPSSSIATMSITFPVYALACTSANQSSCLGCTSENPFDGLECTVGRQSAFRTSVSGRQFVFQTSTAARSAASLAWPFASTAKASHSRK